VRDVTLGPKETPPPSSVPTSPGTGASLGVLLAAKRKGSEMSLTNVAE
jgi:hypothetical protein